MKQDNFQEVGFLIADLVQNQVSPVEFPKTDTRIMVWYKWSSTVGSIHLIQSLIGHAFFSNFIYGQILTPRLPIWANQLALDQYLEKSNEKTCNFARRKFSQQFMWAKLIQQKKTIFIKVMSRKWNVLFRFHDFRSDSQE